MKMSTDTWFEIGENAQIDPNVVLGYRFAATRNPLRIGANAVIRSGTTIYTDTTIGERFQCGHQVLIRAEVKIGNRCVVHHQCTLEGRLQIGNGVKIMAQVYVPSTTRIGDLVFIGPGTTFLNDKYPMRKAAPVEGPTIGNGVCIGGGVTICPGVRIGENALVGAGSVVNKDVPPDVLAYGNPARHYPMPEGLGRGNLPELLLPQTDLFGAQTDESWKEENWPSLSDEVDS